MLYQLSSEEIVVECLTIVIILPVCLHVFQVNAFGQKGTGAEAWWLALSCPLFMVRTLLEWSRVFQRSPLQYVAQFSFYGQGNRVKEDQFLFLLLVEIRIPRGDKINSEKQSIVVVFFKCWQEEIVGTEFRRRACSYMSGFMSGSSIQLHGFPW